MKKVLFILGAAALVLASCAKSETVVKETAPGEITFKAITTPVTKTGELDGATLTGKASPNHFGMWVSATLKDKDGNIDFGTFLNDQAFGPTAGLWSAGSYATTTPFAFTKQSVYWPIGGVKIDFLAYAMKAADKATQTAAGQWVVNFPNATASPADIASKLTVSSVDTYTNQVDFMYAHKNDATNALNGNDNSGSGGDKYVPLLFKHAQALLIFNVKKDAASADVKIKGIHFWDKDYVAGVITARRTAAADPTSTDGDATLETQGTLTIDNTKNDLVVDWGTPTAVFSKSSMPTDASAVLSPLNTAAAVLDYATGIATVDFSDAFKQLGNSLLIIPQKKENFTIEYAIGDQTVDYLYTYNDLRGQWEAGKVYIYNLTLSANEIIITETVNPFDDATGYPANIDLL